MTVAYEGMSFRPSANKFAPFKKADRNFFLLIVALIWFGILMGFVPELIHHYHSDEAAYTWVMPYHGTAFVGWLVLFTVQVLLARSGAMRVHRTLGLIAVGLVPTMIVLGTMAAFISERRDLGTPASDPAFMSLMLGDMVVFAGIASAGLILRGSPVAHKRLMLLSTIILTDAGYGRWWQPSLHRMFGDGFWQFWVENYLGPIVLILLAGAYDLATRRRLHPAYVWAAVWVFGFELVASYLYVSPWWTNVATGLITTYG